MEHAALASPIEGRADRRTLLFAFAVSLLSFSLYYVLIRGSVPSFWNDSYEYAQVARNIAEGRGIRTSAATVLETWFLGHAGLPLPYLLHDPGNSLLMATLFRVFGARAAVIGWSAGLCFVLLGPLTYLLGCRVFRPGAALLGALLVAVNSQLLIFAGAGYSEVPIAFFLTLLFHLLLGGGAPAGRLAAGLVFGYLVLLRANSLPFLPWLLLFIAAAGKPRGVSALGTLRGATRPILAFLLGVALVLGPNALRNYHWTGHPFYMVSSFYTLAFHTSAVKKANEVFSQPGLNIDPVRHVLDHPDELLAKMQWQLSREGLRILEGGFITSREFASSLLVFLFLVAALAPPPGEDPQRRRFRWLVVASVATMLLVGSAFHLRWRHLYGFLPVVTLFAAEQLSTLAAAGPPGRKRFLAVVVLLVAAYGAHPLADSREADSDALARREHFYQKLGGFLRHYTPEDAVVLVEPVGRGRFDPMGNALAWHSRRTFLQWSTYTLGSPLLRGTDRPLYALAVLENEGDPSRSAAPGAAALDHPGFAPLASWVGNGGGATLFH